MQGITPTLQLELLGRLTLAVLLGSVLGWERQMGRHPAGLRTHMLVSLGAAAYTIAGAFGGWALLGGGVGTVEDPGRVAAQIITGIGFLGAGTIWRSSGEEGVIRGLTTAASIWVAAAIGMLTGYGLYVLAGGTAVLSLLILRLMRRVERAPRVLGGVVARRLGRQRGTAYQPARSPSVMESQPAHPVEIETFEVNGVPSDSDVVLDGADLDANVPPVTIDTKAKRDRMHKKLRKGKKGRKGKRRDLPSEELDQISDAPVPNSPGRN